jgi:coenzyme F420-reducing hydrogenase beta subunit
MISVKQKELCCGCYACQNICPKECIKMQSDLEGFFYPNVDTAKCISCNLCVKVCPILNPVAKNKIIQTYTGAIKDTAILKNSTSGGAFSALSRAIFNHHGIVFGAGFDSNFTVVHYFANCMKEIENMKGSKYVQSSLPFIYNRYS